jgi:hypothetical protein
MEATETLDDDACLSRGALIPATDGRVDTSQ